MKCKHILEKWWLIFFSFNLQALEEDFVKEAQERDAFYSKTAFIQSGDWPNTFAESSTDSPDL